MVAAVAAMLGATRAQAAFVRITDAVLAVDGSFVCSADCFGDGALQAGTSCTSMVPAPDGEPQDQDTPRVLPECRGHLAETSGAMDSEPTSQSSGNGTNGAAITSTIAQVPQTALTGRLPYEMGPSFSNPPPWTPLRPPRGGCICLRPFRLAR